jgi:hypothetical protein
MISPKMRMAVTEMRMAAQGLSRRSRKMGSASMHRALHRRSVHRRWCGLASSCSGGSEV